MARVMAIDHGDVRTGVAFSDLTRTLAGETLTLAERNAVQLCAKLAELARLREVDTIVLGWPLNMDDTPNARTEKVQRLEARLRKALEGCAIVRFDERLTTVEAYDVLRGVGKSAKKGRKNVDAVAASLILEGWLSSPAAFGGIPF